MTKTVRWIKSKAFKIKLYRLQGLKVQERALGKTMCKRGIKVILKTKSGASTA